MFDKFLFNRIFWYIQQLLMVIIWYWKVDQKNHKSHQFLDFVPDEYLSFRLHFYLHEIICLKISVLLVLLALYVYNPFAQLIFV